jgi:hypothetical protein
MKLTKQMRKDIEAWLKREDQESACPFKYGATFRGIDKCIICNSAFGMYCPCCVIGIERVRKVAKKALKTGEL